jgi:hypothetical protein
MQGTLEDKDARIQALEAALASRSSPAPPSRDFTFSDLPASVDLGDRSTATGVSNVTEDIKSLIASEVTRGMSEMTRDVMSGVTSALAAHTDSVTEIVKQGGSPSTRRSGFVYRGGLSKEQQPCAGCRALGIDGTCKFANMDNSLCSKKCTKKRRGFFKAAVDAWEERTGRKYE